MGPVRVVITEDHQQQLNELEAYLCACPGITVAGTAADGASALRLAETLLPDVMVYDLMLPQMDGFTLLTRLNALPGPQRPRSVILSALTRSDFVARAFELGAACVLPKPADLPRLAAVVLEQGALPAPLPPTQTLPSVLPPDEEPVSEEIVLRYISQILLRAGLSPHLNGHRYIQRAVALALHSPDLLNHMLTDLYPAVAHCFDTTAGSVERAIRFAITRAWDSGGAQALNKLLGRPPELYHEKPSNREFIALIAERVRLRRQD